MTAFTRCRCSRGLSLTELMVVTALFSALSGMIYGTFRYQTHTYMQQTAQSVTQDRLRIWIDQIVRDIRRAGYDPQETGLFGIESFSTTELRFTADTNANGVLDSGAAENLGYRFENGTLWRRLGGENWRPLLTGVGGLAFTYRDVKGNVVSTVKEAISFVEVAFSAQATAQAVAGVDTSPSHSPTVVVGTGRTTVSVPSIPGFEIPVYGRLERAAIRNPK